MLPRRLNERLERYSERKLAGMSEIERRDVLAFDEWFVRRRGWVWLIWIFVAGAAGALVAALALRDQVVSPTLRLETPDPQCDLDCTPKQAKARKLRAALVNAFAFGGNNVSLALRRWEGR
jgi:hypothetical protein